MSGARRATNGAPPAQLGRAQRNTLTRQVPYEPAPITPTVVVASTKCAARRAGGRPPALPGVEGPGRRRGSGSEPEEERSARPPDGGSGAAVSAEAGGGGGATCVGSAESAGRLTSAIGERGVGDCRGEGEEVGGLVDQINGRREWPMHTSDRHRIKLYRLTALETQLK